MSRRLCHIVDDVNPVDETNPDVLAPMELFKSQNSNRCDEDEDENEDSNQQDGDEFEDENEDSNQQDGDEFEDEDSNQQDGDEFEDEDEDSNQQDGDEFEDSDSDSDSDSIDFQYDEDENLNSVPNDILDFVGDLVKGSTHIVDQVLQGSEAHTDKKEEKGLPTSTRWIYLQFFFSKMDPLFKQIVCEMKACKNGVEPDEKAKTILNMLPKYSWRGKAKLTLAAFAVVFGDFCVFAKIHHLAYEQVLKSLAIQKGSSELLKRQVKIHQLKEIIETILQVMDLLTDESMDELQMDENYNLIITTVVACAIEVSNLTNDKESDDSQNLSPYLEQIQEVQIILEKERDEFNNHCEAIKKLQDSHTDFVEILKTKFFLNDNQPELIDASASREPVKIDVLRGKNVFLFISSLDDVSEYEILNPKTFYKATKKDNDCTIVWIPIVKEWTDELRNKLDTILSLSNKMFWYVLPSFSLSVNGIKFIKANWYSIKEDNPKLVLLNPQGNLENRLSRKFNRRRRKEWISKIAKELQRHITFRKHIKASSKPIKASRERISFNDSQYRSAKAHYLQETT